jgi:hypothetical protein
LIIGMNCFLSRLIWIFVLQKWIDYSKIWNKNWKILKLRYFNEILRLFLFLSFFPYISMIYCLITWPFTLNYQNRKAHEIQMMIDFHHYLVTNSNEIKYIKVFKIISYTSKICILKKFRHNFFLHFAKNIN